MFKTRPALERVRFELNHDRALSFCFDAFSSTAFSSEVESVRVKKTRSLSSWSELERKTGTHFC
jgi:hypothetical protein